MPAPALPCGVSELWLEQGWLCVACPVMVTLGGNWTSFKQVT